MSSTKKLIGILGGTFDPIHSGHLQLAKNVIDDLKFESIQFIPNREPPHREHPIASAKHRLAMTQIAVANNPQFIVNDLEIKRPAPSYMIDTLQTLHHNFANQPLCLIIGLDAFNQFNTWKDWQKISGLAHLIVVNRNGDRLNEAAWMKQLLQNSHIQNPDELATQASGLIYFYQMKPIDIAATEIRQRLAENADVSGLLPKAVIDYIQQHKLYSC